MGFLCKIVGHKWRYKDYTNAIKPNGEKFLFTSSRRCKRCDEYQYKYTDWVNKDSIYPEDRKAFFGFPGSLHTSIKTS